MHTVTIQKVFDTPERIAQGLMYDYDPLLPSCGALFVFPQERVGSFWMKNTPRALDMVFIKSNYQISYIYEGAIPFDEKSIISPMPVKYVIEFLAGYVQLHNLKEGDYVQFKRKL
jgi:uncharacterized membrane protein (UPF0127 family)